MDVDAHLRDPTRKQAFVTPMFDIIAPRYDDFTRRFSWGMDARWKSELFTTLSRIAAPDATVLDVACGTGDIAFAATARLPRSRVIGIDASPRMIEQAERRRSREGEGSARIRFAVGDLGTLDLPDASVDVITGGYALRNVPDHSAALRELARVLRPGGHLLTLDFYRPRQAPWRSLFLGYLAVAGNAVGWLWHRSPVVYGYIWRSIDHYVSCEDFSAALGQSGFDVLDVKRMLGGGVARHVARRAR